MTEAQSNSGELTAHRLFHQGDYRGARQIFEQLLESTHSDDVRAIYEDCVASCVASEGDYEQATRIFASIKPVTNSLIYNRALCAYKQGNLDESMSLVDQLIDRCERLQPELFLIDERHLAKNMRSPSSDHQNSDSLRLLNQLEESCLLEAINLKSAIAFRVSGGYHPMTALQILNQSPLKSHQLLDCVTLHNQAIYELQSLPEESLRKLLHVSQLKQQTTNEHYSDDDDFGLRAAQIPREIDQNLISILIYGGRVDLAAEYFRNLKQTDGPRSSSGGGRGGLTKAQIMYIDLQLEHRNPRDDSHYVEKLEKLLDQLLNQIKSSQTKAIENIDMHSIVDLAMVVASDLGSILWSDNQYKATERLMEKIKFLYTTSQHYEDLWLKNMAHVLFMMDNRFEECSQMYERLVMSPLGGSSSSRSPDARGDDSPAPTPTNLTDSTAAAHQLDPMILGNLCVSYVLTGRNGEAEELIKRIELEQEEIKQQQSTAESMITQQQQHQHQHQITQPPPQQLDIVNLAVETLYCVKNNYEFGLTRMFKTLYPLELRLTDQVWFHVKRCILSLLDGHCKQLIYVRDGLMNQVLEFLIDCEKNCQHIRTTTTLATKISTNYQEKPDQESQTTTSMTTLTDVGDKLILADQSTNQDQSGQPPMASRDTIFYEARYLRAIILAIIHDN